MQTNHTAPHAIFEYSYRDASGYAVYDCVLLSGSFSEADKDLISSRLESHQFFIPEKVGIPPLQVRLYEYSDGQPTEDDHPWHELIDLRPATPDEIDSLNALGDTRELVSRFSGISDWESWRYSWDNCGYGRK